MKLRLSGCDLNCNDLPVSGRGPTKGHIIARSSGINHFLNRAVPIATPLFWATTDIFNAFGPVLHKKLIKIVTGMAKELMCYPNAGQLANEVCYRVVKHLVSFKVGGKIRSDIGNLHS